MSVIYVDGKAREIERGTLADLLARCHPLDVVALDTETSGLFIDGDYTDAPPARMSVVSIAFVENDGSAWSYRSMAFAFDQGRVGGKPGRWLDELDGYEVLPHTPNCGLANVGVPVGTNCVCAPWNLSEADWRALCEWLADKRIVMHNAKFDLHIMRAGHRVYGQGIDLESNAVWDTMLAQGIISPLESSSLEPTSVRLFGYDSSKAPHKEAVKAALKKNGVGLTWRYDLIAWDVLGPYADSDALLTIKLFYYQQEQIETGSVDAIEQNIIDGWTDTPIGRVRTGEIPLAYLLYRMEQRGVEFDAEGMRAEAVKMQEEIKRLERQLPFSPPNVNAAKRYFFEQLGIMPIKTTPKGAPSLDAEVAARLAADKVPGAAEWVHLANLNSALSKWYRAWPYKAGPDGRIRTNFRQGRIESDRPGQTSGGAISGRLSAERVQMQGVPKEFRIPDGIKPVKAFFKAKPGYQLWELDISNAEIRVAAWLSQCQALADRCNSGANIHDENTMAIFGIEPDHPQWEEYRGLAKIGVFSDLYGAGVRQMKAQFESGLKKDFPERVVRDFKARLAEAYPELKRTARGVQRKADRSMGGCGYVRLVNGRRRWFGWAEKTHKAMNACIQGGVAETMKVFMLMVEQMVPGALLNQVHDSVWLELPNETALEDIERVKAAGEELFTRTFSTPKQKVLFTLDAKRIA